MPVLSLPTDAVLESLPPDAVLESASPPAPMRLPPEAVIESPPPTPFTPAAPFQPQEDQGFDWSKEASGVPQAGSLAPVPLARGERDVHLSPMEELRRFAQTIAMSAGPAEEGLVRMAGSGLSAVGATGLGNRLHGAADWMQHVNEMHAAENRPSTGREFLIPAAQTIGSMAMFGGAGALGGTAGLAVAGGGMGAGNLNTAVYQQLKGKIDDDSARKIAALAGLGGLVTGGATSRLFGPAGSPAVNAGLSGVKQAAGNAFVANTLQGGSEEAIKSAATGKPADYASVIPQAIIGAVAAGGIHAFFNLFSNYGTATQREAAAAAASDHSAGGMPEAEARQWLGLAPDGALSPEDVTAAWRTKVQQTHPDAGGTVEDFARTAAARASLRPVSGPAMAASPVESSVKSPVTTLPPDAVLESLPVIQKGGAQREIQEGQAQGQEVLSPAQAQSQSTGVAGAPVAPVSKSSAGFSRAALEKTLIERFDPSGNESVISAGSELDQVPYSNVWRGKSAKDLPEEMQHAIQANPDLARAINFTPDGPTGGPDALHEFGSRYFDLLGQLGATKSGKLDAAIQSARQSQDPETQFLAALHDNLPAPQDRVPQTTIDPSKDLQTGDEFEIQGHRFQVIEDEDGYRVLKDGNEYPAVPVDALGKIPIDKGFDIKKGAESDIPTDLVPAQHSRVSTGLFGQGVIDSAGIGAQQPMFHQPLDTPSMSSNPQDAAIAKKFDPKATPELFRQGAVNTKVFTAPVESLVKDDIVPSAKAVGSAFASAKEDLQRVFAPQARGAAATFAKGALREAGSEIDRRDAIAEKAFRTAERHFEKQPKQNNLDFYTAVETAQPITDPALRPAQSLLRDAFEKRYGEMKSLGIEPGYIQDYLPHLYNDPAKAQAFASDFLARRPMEGTKFFKKQRAYPTLQDGVNAGLEPRTYNPMTMARLALHQMDKYIAISNVKAELKTNKMRIFVSAGSKPPQGWAMTNDRADTVFGMSAQNERVIRGHYYYPEPVVGLVNNYLSPGIGNRQWYRGLMWLKNNMNLFNLGYSAFHITFTTGNSFFSKIGTALQYLGDGNLKMAAVKAAEVPYAPFADLVRGSRVLSEWVKPGSAGHDYAKVVDAYLAGGGVATRPKAYQGTITKNMIDAISKGNVVGALVRIPAATAQSLGHLIMEQYVPRIKNGAAVDQLRMELDRHQGGVTRPQLREMMGKIVDRQDDQFGELQYRNLFWNKTAHQLGQLFVRAQGWTLGSLRLGAHAAVDTAKTPWRTANGKPLITLSMGRALGIAIGTAAIGAVIQKLLSGKDPEDAKDLIYPRTGDKDREGNEVRLKLPTYANEAMSWERHPLATAGHKLSPLVSEMLDAATNRDYFGNKITDPNSPPWQRIKDYAAFFGKQQLPFSVQSQQQLKGEGAPLGTRILSGIGINRAPMEMIRSDALNLAAKFSADSRSVAGLTPAQQAKADIKRQIEDAMLKDRADGIKAMQQAVRDGSITMADAKTIMRALTETALQYRVKSETADQAVQVFDVASDAEKSEIRPLVLQKIVNSKTLNPDQKRALIAPVRDWKKAG